MLAAAVFGPTEELGKAGSNASDVLVSQGPLGALVVILIIAVGLLIWLLHKSKDNHIKDKDTMIHLMKDQSVEVQGLLKDNKNAIDNMTREVVSLNNQIDKTNTSINNLSQQWQLWQMTQGRTQGRNGD